MEPLALHRVAERCCNVLMRRCAAAGSVRQLCAPERAERVQRAAPHRAGGRHARLPALAARDAAREAHPVKDQCQDLIQKEHAEHLLGSSERGERAPEPGDLVTDIKIAGRAAGSRRSAAPYCTTFSCSRVPLQYSIENAVIYRRARSCLASICRQVVRSWGQSTLKKSCK